MCVNWWECEVLVLALVWLTLRGRQELSRVLRSRSDTFSSQSVLVNLEDLSVIFLRATVIILI